MVVKSLVSILILISSVAGSMAAEPPSEQRIVFLGDSITQSGRYIEIVEAALVAQYPDLKKTFIPLGLSSETVSGLSESGHANGKFPRPDLHERLDRILEKAKPELVIACYGMNDGIYHPLDPQRTRAFQDGMRKLHTKVTATGARIIHLTPPVFDPVPIQSRLLPAGLDRYEKPYEGYNDVLEAYSEWLLSMRSNENWDVLDVHGPMKAALAAKRGKDPAFTFAKDGVHPSPEGQLVIARVLLAAWGLKVKADGTPDHIQGAAILQAIQKKHALLRLAWLGHIGHQRPGVAAGLPLDEAEKQAAVLDNEIRRLTQPEPTNVLFIAIDDLNDWLGCLGGHPQARTPNMDRLAKRGTLFMNAHCAAPLCNPSRAAVFSGYQPFATGVFANNDANIRKLRPDLVLIPEYFHQHGYQTFGTGKLLHQNSDTLFDESFSPEQRWSPFTREQMKYAPDELPSKGTDNPRHATELDGKPVIIPLNRMPSDRNPDSTEGESFDWGPLDVDDLAMGDGQITSWAVERLSKHHSAPFFIGVGYYRPHIPLYAPKKYFDLFDHQEIQLPPSKSDDLNDLPATARQFALAADTAGAHATVIQYGQWQAAVKAYLACVAFVDAQVGRLIDAVDSSPHSKNTVIVLWSDHGWHLGEKEHWGKWTGWQRSTRVALMIAPPHQESFSGLARGSQCHEAVSLLDLYPTLIEFSGIPKRDDLQGRSLIPQMRAPKSSSDRAVVTTFDKGNYSISGTRWHYLRYADGSEELYDRERDSNEWHNLANQSEYSSIKMQMQAWLPNERDYPAPAAGGSGAKRKKGR